MTFPALHVESVSKKFKKGELHDSLRDFVPAFCKRIVRGKPAQELSRREFWALRDVSFEVDRGDVLGIIGHNGAGKSTMLKLLSGVMRPTKGDIRVNGTLSALIEVGAGFHLDLTGRENIFLNGAILGMKRCEIVRKFDEIVAFSGLEPFIDTPVKRYSTGMYARLGFSVAAHVNPDILIVDEVLSVGDYLFQNKCMKRMKSVVREGAAVVFVSHNLHAVVELCDRAILLDHGCVVAEGSPQEVVRTYLDRLIGEDCGDEDSDAYVAHMEVRGEHGPQMRFEPGDYAWVDIEVKARRRCERLSLSIFLKDDNNYLLFDTSTERLGHASFALDAGESVHFSFRLKLHLGRGDFFLGTTIYRYDISKLYEERFPTATIFIDSDIDVRGSTNLYPIVTNGKRLRQSASEVVACID